MTRAISRPMTTRPAPARLAQSRSAKASGGGGSSIRLPRQWENYFKQSELPLASLVFLLPMLAFFEIGTLIYPSDPIAFHLFQVFYSIFGANERFLPALGVVTILLAWHLLRKGKWQFSFQTIIGMAVESLLLCLPLLTLAAGLLHTNFRNPIGVNMGNWPSDIVLSVGAGIYEELLFRLIVVALLSLLLVNILKVPKKSAYPLIVLISAVSFALYHYLGNEPFSLRTFAFRTVAGAYFSLIFLLRGFGITCGCHVVYDLLIVVLTAPSYN
jgi:membrane protease YdiL (CAAX protease family)